MKIIHSSLSLIIKSGYYAFIKKYLFSLEICRIALGEYYSMYKISNITERNRVDE